LRGALSIGGPRSARVLTPRPRRSPGPSTGSSPTSRRPPAAHGYTRRRWRRWCRRRQPVPPLCPVREAGPALRTPQPPPCAARDCPVRAGYRSIGAAPGRRDRAERRCVDATPPRSAPPDCSRATIIASGEAAPAPAVRAPPAGPARSVPPWSRQCRSGDRISASAPVAAPPHHRPPPRGHRHGGADRRCRPRIGRPARDHRRTANCSRRTMAVRSNAGRSSRLRRTGDRRRRERRSRGNAAAMPVLRRNRSPVRRAASPPVSRSPCRLVAQPRKRHKRRRERH